MTDLTQITTPLGLLEKTKPEVVKALKEHGGPYEYWLTYHKEWMTETKPVWAESIVYRVKPATKPSVDWSQVAEGWDWLARDASGKGVFHKREPVEMECLGRWVSGGSSQIEAEIVSSYDPGTCHWRDSLVRRPE